MRPQPAQPQPPPARKPYVRPAFVHEPAFETMALACGKIEVTQSQCRLNRKAS